MAATIPAKHRRPNAKVIRTARMRKSARAGRAFRATITSKMAMNPIPTAAAFAAINVHSAKAVIQIQTVNPSHAAAREYVKKKPNR